MRYGAKVGLVLRVGLDSQAGGKDELADGSSEAGEESIEGLYGRVSRGWRMRQGGFSVRSFHQ